MKDLIQNIKYKFNQSDIAHRMATGAFWSLAGSVFAKIIVLVSSIVCAHILGKAEYGEFGMVRSTINMFVIIGTAGLGATATKYIAEFRTHHKERIGSIYLLTSKFALFTGVLVLFAILVFSNFLSTNMLKAPNLAPSVRVGGLLLFVSVINGAQQGTLSGFENFKAIAINTFIGSIAESIFMLFGAYYYGVFGAVLGYGMGFIALYIVNHLAIKKTFKCDDIQWNVHKKITKNDWSLLYKFSLPAALSSLLVTPIFWIVRTFLVRHDGFESLANYEAAEQWRAIILFIPSAISGIVLPILSSIVNEDKNKFWKVLKYNIVINLGVSTLLAFTIAILSSYIMHFYGIAYNDKWPLLLLALSTIPNSIAVVVGLSIASRAKMWIGFSFNAAWGVVFALLSYHFIQIGMQASGIGMALLISYTLHSFIQLIYLKFSIKNN